MITTTSRRAILAGAASLATVPALAKGARTPDPIFELIEAHKRAFVKRAQTLNAHFADEACEAAEAASYAAAEACNDAAMQLAYIEPTTTAGLLALIEYVDAFNRGEFLIEGIQSGTCEWPGGNLVDEDIYTHGGGEAGELGFAFAILLNVRDALVAMAVQS